MKPGLIEPFPLPPLLLGRVQSLDIVVEGPEAKKKIGEGCFNEREEEEKGGLN